MQDYTGQTPSARDLTKAVDGIRSQQAHCQEDGETRVVVDDSQHAPSLLTEFHSAFPSLMRDELGDGVSSAATLPAGDLCKHTCPRVIRFPLAAPPPAQLANAMAVALQPEHVHDRPILRRLAWSTLMAARGHWVNQTRLAQLQRGAQK
jgi:hypothetical protein